MGLLAMLTSLHIFDVHSVGSRMLVAGGRFPLPLCPFVVLDRPVVWCEAGVGDWLMLV